MNRAPDKSTAAIIEAANEWLLRLHDERVSAADERAFDAWLRESPVHVREYLRAESNFAALEGIDAGRRIPVAELLREDEPTVVSLNPPAGTPVPAGGARENSLPALWLSSAAAIVLAVAAGWWFGVTADGQQYSTGLGEQRRLVLEDGSVIEMNTRSVLEVHFDEEQRAVRLLGGEALFEVSKDPERPFRVTTDSALIEAVGTQFNIRSSSEDVTVTVVEGIVDVRSRNAGRQTGQLGQASGGSMAETPVEVTPVRLKVGQQARVESRSGRVAVLDATVNRAIAWQERRLIFDNQSLSEAVAEFNRYNQKQLIIHDAALGEQRISAVFDADQPEALLRFLSQHADIRVVEESPTRLVIQSPE